MRCVTDFTRCLLVLGVTSGWLQAGSVLMAERYPSIGSEVFCPPAVSQVKTFQYGTGSDVAVSGCTNGTRSEAALVFDIFTRSASAAVSAQSYGGSRAGNPALDAPGPWAPYFHVTPPAITPSRGHSSAALSVQANFLEQGDIDTWEFQLDGYASDPGAALRFWVHYVGADSAQYDLNSAYAGPIDLHQRFSLTVRSHPDINVFGAAVVATSTPEPGTLWLVGAAALLSGIRWTSISGRFNATSQDTAFGPKGRRHRS